MDGLVHMERPIRSRPRVATASEGRVRMTADGGDAVDGAGLIAAIADRQDRAAFGRLFAYYAPRLKTYLLRRGVTAELAEELAQETMLAVWRKAALFDPARASASTWIFAIVRNLHIDRLRQDRFVAADADVPEEVDSRPTADLAIEAAQRAARLRAALARLPAEQVDVVRLSFFDERPHAEIERALGIPLGTVKSRLRLAVAKLRTLLEGDA